MTRRRSTRTYVYDTILCVYILSKQKYIVDTDIFKGLCLHIVGRAEYVPTRANESTGGASTLLIKCQLKSFSAVVTTINITAFKISLKMARESH